MWDSIAFAISSTMLEQDKRKRLEGVKVAIDNSRFNRTGFPFDKESRRDAQFKFFGYKPKRFISVYAKKPKVRVKVKAKIDQSRVTNINYNDSRTAYIDRQMAYLQQQQMQQMQLNRQYSAMTCQQTHEFIQAQQAMASNYHGGIGGLFTVGSGLKGVY